jgi:type II secretory pathway pseudopilin PulG
MKKVSSKSNHERGYILLAVMLLMTLMLIAMTIEAPRIAQQIKREKEEELIHRGDQYRVAIKKFYRKNGTYPISLDQLVSTNNVRYLRKRYKDPITGKDDWHLLHVGEVQLNPLTGGVNAAGAAAAGQPTGNTSPFSSNLNSSPSPGPTAATPPAASSGISPAASTTQQNGPTSIGTPASGISVGSGNQQFGGGPIIGVSSVSEKKSIKEINGKDHYKDWQFVYDPRLEVRQGLGAGAGGIQGATPIGGQTPTQQPLQGPGPTGGLGSNPSSPPVPK